ncbi:hypothetical protein AURDEDRAFT_164311 [Auricularia subglabra TFB-10046 SS5]|nr:hypothetical protein AURDEDRAFT_164311 [Auricularia subglabra TFB-10046 SS5]
MEVFARTLQLGSEAHGIAEKTAECIADENGERQIACAVSYNGEETHIGFRNLLGKKFSDVSEQYTNTTSSAPIIKHPDSDLPAYSVEPTPAPSPPPEPQRLTKILSVPEVTTLFLRSLLQSATVYLGTRVDGAVLVLARGPLLDEPGAAALLPPDTRWCSSSTPDAPSTPAPARCPLIVDAVLLVGGSARLPGVIAQLDALFQVSTTVTSSSPPNSSRAGAAPQTRPLADSAFELAAHARHRPRTLRRRLSSTSLGASCERSAGNFVAPSTPLPARRGVFESEEDEDEPDEDEEEPEPEWRPDKEGLLGGVSAEEMVIVEVMRRVALELHLDWADAGPSQAHEDVHAAGVLTSSAPAPSYIWLLSSEVSITFSMAT